LGQGHPNEAVVSIPQAI
jgi:alpha-tubulin suppressor-like RCC1 family protein